MEHSVKHQQSFDYAAAPKEHIRCDYCGSDRSKVIARRTQNGTAAHTEICVRCGLVFINPRMTEEGYKQYYDHVYRAERATFKNSARDADLEHLFVDSRQYGSGLARRLRNFFRPGMLVDVGSSTGGVLAGIQDVIPEVTPLGIEPSPHETAIAHAHGIETIESLFENLPEDVVGEVQTVICTQSLNHLLRPRLFFEWAMRHLAPGGHLILVVKNWRHQCRRAGRVESGIQIDHPFMFVPEVLAAFLASTGFEVVYLDSDEYKDNKTLERQRAEGLSVHHIRVVGRKPTHPTGSIRSPHPWYAWRLRLQISRPFLVLYYLLHYARRTKGLRAVLGLRSPTISKQ